MWTAGVTVLLVMKYVADNKGKLVALSLALIIIRSACGALFSVRMGGVLRAISEVLVECTTFFNVRCYLPKNFHYLYIR